MKIRIIDLMDHYYGKDSVKLNKVNKSPNHAKTSSQTPIKRNREIKPWLIAACVICIVVSIGAVIALPLWARPSGGQDAYQEGAVSAENGSWGLSNFESPSDAPEADAEEISSETIISPQIISGTMDTKSIYCDGNMFSVDGQYYTLTDTGPELLETENLHTTIELYGSWEVDIDYAVVDGELAFYNNVSTESYAIYNGEKLTQQEYHDGGMSATYGELTWIEPAVAYALPLDGSSDTVILRIYRQDKPAYERVAYVFLYNIFSGEIIDPLSNVPELFDHGCFCSATFNTTATRALVTTYESNNYSTYVCDLTTGDMMNVSALANANMPTSETPGTVFSARSENCVWADDNTLLFRIMESTPNGNEKGYTEDGEYISDYDDCYWLCSYNISTETLNYQKRNVSFLTQTIDGTYRYLHGLTESEHYFQVVDTQTGTTYELKQEITACGWRETKTQAVIDEDNTILLIDDSKMAWIQISDYMELPDSWDSVILFANDWILLTNADSVFCYKIPDTMTMVPLE